MSEGKSNIAGDEFFVGYLPAMPAGHGRRTRAAAAVFAVVGVVVAVLSTTLRRDPGPGIWRSDVVREFSGVIRAKPYPILYIPEDGGHGRAAILVGTGKHRAAVYAGQLDKPVTVRGTLLERDGCELIEIDDGSDAIKPGWPASMPGDRTRPTDRAAPARVTLRGEIVDPKCYSGAMKPGDGKSHRACAVRCISGGIPPVLVVVNADGSRSHYLLADASGGRLNEEILPFVGDVVELAGELREDEGLATVLVALASVRRLP